MSKDVTLSEEAIRRKLGTREPVRGAGQRPGPNWERKETPSKQEPQADFSGVLNPKRVIEKRREKAEEAAGLKCGGKVRKMAAGGSVRGVGCASKGTKFKGSY